MLRAVLVCLVVLGAASAAPTAEEHSVQKRQTTVTFVSNYEQIREVFVNIVVAFAFATAVVIIGLPLLGYKIDVVVGAAQGLLNPAPAAAEPAVYAEPTSYESYSRSLKEGVTSLGARVLNSLDVVEAALTYMSVEEEACRFKAVCLAERAAVNNPFGALAINTINSHLSGLSKYGSAVEAGLNGEDCELLYDQCPDHIGF